MNRNRRSGRGRGRQNAPRFNDRRHEDKTQDGNNSATAAPSHSSHKYFIGYKKLEELMGKDTGEVILHFTNQNNCFKELLDSAEQMKKPDVVEMVINLILRCEENTTMKELVSDVMNMTAKSNFYLNISSQLIMKMIVEKIETHQVQYKCILKGCLKLCEKLMLRVPTLAFEGIFLFRSALETHIPRLRLHTVIVDDEILSSFATLKESTEFHLHHAVPKTEEHVSPHDSMTPPDDFRNLTSIPTKNDLHMKEAPFLRVNKAYGAYNDVDHYLDVQYRLLREDFISPLREGIEEYLQRSCRRHRMSNVILYENVRFVKPVCSYAGIVYVLQLDTTRLRPVRWQSSKRLIFGSLVCLSKDNFQTFIIATVHERRVEVLESRGQITVQLPDKLDVVECSFDASYVMLETTAYFESYRHVLDGLQEITNDMAFKEHFVFCSAAVKAPTYLTRTSNVYLNFTSVLPEDATMSMKEAFKKVDSLNTGNWPQDRHLGLDSSQWKAFLNALTKKLSIIQGPPGTGKTFIGLKLAKFLLANYEVWADDGEEMRPILVVCYTNHALDQFLEGVLKFAESSDIVRVGGRSKSVELEACMLTTLRRHVDKRAEHVRTAFQSLKANTKALQLVENKINDLAKMAEKANNSILPTVVFNDIMTDRQKQQLWYEPNSGADPMKEWLGLHGENLNIMLRQQCKSTEDWEMADEPEIMEEADIVEAERALDVDDDWAHILQGTNDVADNEEDEQEWKDLSRSEKQALRRLLKHSFNSNDIMTEQEAEQVIDPWQLDDPERWKLYKYWTKRYLASLNRQVKEQNVNYTTLIRQRNEINNRKDALIMRHAKVIGMTTTGCARYRQILKTIQPKIVIVEEAAEVLEAHIITALSERCEHLIMIGDHKQLRPSPAVHKLAKKYKLDISLFERMIKNNLPFACLQNQHRMRPEISQTMRFIYPELNDAESVKRYEHIHGISTNMFFIDHSYPESGQEETRSHSNKHEAEFTIQLCRYLLKQGYQPSQVTILTPYYGQLIRFKDYIRSKHIQELKDVRITVVDNFQGEENDIILLSLVRSNNDGNIGFLKIENRVCVALSRAKKGLFVIGNFKLLSSNSELWNRIEKHMRQQRSIGDYLELKCQIHCIDRGVQMAKAEDFDTVAEGGCKRMCEFRLICGHTCPRQCHIYDREHIDMTQRCRQPCARIPSCGVRKHACPRRCNEDCGPCQHPTKKILPRCGHEQIVKCGENLDAVICEQPCHNRLSCGHGCAAGCSQPCVKPCEERIIRQLRCGHEMEISCHTSIDQALCRKKCTNRLRCGHYCSGICHTCYGGHLHRSCLKKCDLTLVCGHICREPCTRECPPCREKCPNRCVHSQCQEKCGDECIRCKEKCPWRCPHEVCTKFCYELCDRERCNQPCKLLVPKPPPGEGPKRRRISSCGHPCIGLCGEQCPKLCRICNKDQVQELFFGDEDKPETRFVELSECGHVFSVAGLDGWMDQQNIGNNVHIKCCPKCKAEIRQHLRYGNVVKKSLEDIEQAKANHPNIKGDNFADVQYIREAVLQAGPMMNRPAQSELNSLVPFGTEICCEHVQYSARLKELWTDLRLFMNGESPHRQPRRIVIANKYKAKFMNDLVKMLNEFEDVLRRNNISRDELKDYTTFSADLEKIADFIHRSENRIRSPRESFSPQQIEDIEWFVTRIKLFSEYLLLTNDAQRHGKTDPSFHECRHLLLKSIPFRERTLEEVQKKMATMTNFCKGLDL